MGHPGVLPVLNQQVVLMGLRLGLALNGVLAKKCWFDRKNYFYPDLPKGYQISQYSQPLINGGYLEINSGREIKKITLERIHIEEDTAKLFHLSNGESLLDFNRAGVPLLEIVTNPDFGSPGEAKTFLQELQLIARYLGISDADMEKGQMRCDVNISLRPEGDKKYYSKTEIKNLNSFKSVEDSLIFEIKRQTDLWNKNKIPKIQNTRGWNENLNTTFEQREKEEKNDYRYFPEPDLPPLYLEDFSQNLSRLKDEIGELPRQKRQRLIDDYALNRTEAEFLTNNKILADFAEQTILKLKSWISSLETVEGTDEEIWNENKKSLAKMAVNWLINRLLPLEDKERGSLSKVGPERFSEFIIFVYKNKIPGNVAQKILEKMLMVENGVEEIIKTYDLGIIDDEDSLTDAVKETLKEYPGIVEKIKKGGVNAVQFLVGQVMKKTKGKADPNLLKGMIEREIF